MEQEKISMLEKVSGEKLKSYYKGVIPAEGKKVAIITKSAGNPYNEKEAEGEQVTKQGEDPRPAKVE